MRIWLRDGTIVYSTDKSIIGQRFPSEDIALAFSGQTVSQLEPEPDDEGGADKDYTIPLLEVYAPIYRYGSRDVIAVGEFYERSSHFVDEINLAKRTTWAIVSATTGAIMLLLYLIVQKSSATIAGQQRMLQRQLTRSRALAAQNEHLHHQAVQSRLEASNASEWQLNRIGSDLHDGPIQLLTVLLLKLRADRPIVFADGEFKAQSTAGEASEVETFAATVMKELRDIAAGLVLPEIGSMTLQQALHLAVVRHQEVTGTRVTETYTDLPEQIDQGLKVCLYRFVQEGLNNAYLHGKASIQDVDVVLTGNEIVASVSDKGVGFLPSEGKMEGRRGLGIQGIRNRILSFEGTLDIRSQPGVGTTMTARIPVRNVGAETV